MQRKPFYPSIATIWLLLTIPTVVAAQQDNSSERSKSDGFYAQASDSGAVAINLSDALRRPLDGSVRFFDAQGRVRAAVEFEGGIGEASLPAGAYNAHVSAVHLGAYFLIDVKPIEVAAGDTAYLIVSLVEGTGSLPLERFDRDHDLAIDRVELAQGTDPEDPSSIPGHERLEWPSPVLQDGYNWYAGDLHTFSRHSIGAESVPRLISRAEKRGLDFLAITDRNTLEHTGDKGYRSNELVLIPGMEWGTEESGYALILKPGTVPLPPNGDIEAQGVLDRVVQQGGVFAPAHPCFPTSPWLRTVGYFNAVEIWCRGWRKMPPLNPGQLPPRLQARSEDDFVFPIARAARAAMHSANGQADFFWRENLNGARKSAAIGGSHSASPKVDIGAPLTHVYAENKSLDAIIRAIRLGRTMVSRDRSSPRVVFIADALNDGKIETHIGGIVPLREETRFFVTIDGGEGKRLEVLLNGQPIRTIDIPEDHFEYAFKDTPRSFSNYIVRITERPDEKGFGISDMLVVTSPIYAQEIVFVDEKDGRSSWVRIDPAPAPPIDLPTPPGF